MDSYYPQDTSGDDAAPDESAAGGGDGGEDTDEKSEKMEGPTALIPKTLLGGKEFKPGEEVVMKIVHDHGDEVEIEYATDESDQPEDGGEDGDSDEMKGSMGKLNSMAT